MKKLEQCIISGSRGTLTIQATKLNLGATAQMKIWSQSAMDIRSTVVRIKGGEKCVARLGDTTVALGGGLARTNSGSRTVYVS